MLGDINLKQRPSILSRTRRVIVKIVEYIPHPDYVKPLTYNDLALLRLERKVNLSRSVLPACLPQPSFRLESRIDLGTTGWGQLGTAGMPIV